MKSDLLNLVSFVTLGKLLCWQRQINRLQLNKQVKHEHMPEKHLTALVKKYVVTELQIEWHELGCPTLLKGFQFSRGQVAKRIIVCEDNTFVAKQVLMKLVRHSPF